MACHNKIDIRPIAPELAEVARIQLNEVENEIPQQVRVFREWIEQQPHIKARTDSQFLIAFLRYSKYNLENAKKRFEYYYTYKSTTALELFKIRAVVDDKMLAICTSGIFATLPKPVGPGGPLIHFTRMGQIDTSIFSIHDIFRYHTIRSEIEINSNDNWIISGVLEIIDFSKIPFSLLRQFEPNLFRKMSALLEHGLPTNLVGTHIVKASIEAQGILTLVRLAMKQKELLNIHSTLESLHDAIGKEYLPVEYGGSNGTLEQAMATCEQQLLEYKDYFIEDVKYGVNEKLRVTDSKSSGNQALSSAEGSFRKLAID